MEKLLKFLLWTCGICAAIFAFGRIFIFESWTIPDEPYLAGSIEPSLGAGDTVLLLTRSEPRFGDLIRCQNPEDPEGWVVGRVVGLSGDEVRIHGNSLRVNGTQYDSSEGCIDTTFTAPHPDTGSPIEFRCARGEMAGGWYFYGTSKRRGHPARHRKEVGEGRLFLLSDNRDLHDDSRDYGTVPVESCQGRIFFRLWGPEGWSDTKRRLSVIR